MTRPGLKITLDRLAASYDRRFLETDPISFAREEKAPGDREVAGLVATSLAYGNVKAIRASVADALGRLGPRPADGLDRMSAGALLARCRGFRHRFTSGRDLAALLWTARAMRRSHGSLGGFFLDGYSSVAPTIREALISFVERALRTDLGLFYRRPPRCGEGIRFLLPSPAEGSACKRLNLFLRWMVRRDDGIDFGLWEEVQPRQLIIPLDTHIARIGAYIGLTRRKSPGWEMAEDITRSLRELDPVDPVRYDFALCRLGILDACPRRRDPVCCAGCSIRQVCLL